jgi:glyoxylase-like metal-dependent hydrolase (beta-lactamase superfamily II)
MNLYSIETGNFKLDGGAMFGVVPKTIWNKLVPSDEKNMCTWAMRCLLVEDGERLLLIDTGIGNKQDEKLFSHYYLHGDHSLDASLAAHGFSRNDITDVFLTHLHFDHCGGAINRDGDRLVPAFPRAQFWSNDAHWKWATQPNDREKASFLRENILPIQESGQLNFVSRQPARNPDSLDQAELIPGFRIRFVDGHTESMMLPQLSYKSRTIVYMADLLPSAAHIPIPYVMAYDMFPLTTLGEKKCFLKEALENDYILFFEHDAVYECCTLQMTEKGIKPKDFFKLSEI